MIPDEYIEVYSDYSVNENFKLYRKIENGKGKWLAEDIVTGKIFAITYQQAMGYEPIRKSPVDNLSHVLGKKLNLKR